MSNENKQTKDRPGLSGLAGNIGDGMLLGVDSGAVVGSRVGRLNRWISRNPFRAILVSVGLVLIAGVGGQVARRTYADYQANAPVRQLEAERAAWRESLERQAAKRLAELRESELQAAMKSDFGSILGGRSSGEVCPSRGFECLGYYYAGRAIQVCLLICTLLAVIGGAVYMFRYSAGEDF